MGFKNTVLREKPVSVYGQEKKEETKLKAEAKSVPPSVGEAPKKALLKK
jgi:hypothetical protein